MKFIFLALGGAGGTMLRYLISELTNRIFSGEFPAGTFAVNMIGSFFIGFAFGITGTFKISPNIKLFLFTGFFGGFTTFSSFSHENANLLSSGNHQHAFLYILASNVLGITLAWAGYFISGSVLNNRS